MSVLIEVLNPTDPDDAGYVMLGLSGKFFDNANTKSYDVTLKASSGFDVIAAVPANAYPEMTNPIEDVEGRCVVIARGTNTFTSKYEQAMFLNASAVIIANNNNAQPSSVLTLYGQISDECFHDHHLDGESFPPCIMISYDSHSHMLKQFNTNPVVKIRMRPVKAVDLPLLNLVDIGVIIRSCCTFDNHPLLLESLAYVFNATSLNSASSSSSLTTNAFNDPKESERLELVGRVIGDIEVGRGANPMHLAVEQNNLPCLSTLLKTSLCTEIRKDDGYTCLHLATEHGRYDSVALLLASGAYIDHPHPIGWTALHFAVYCEHLEIVTLLCEQGASVNALSIDGNSPLHVAAKIGADSCLRKMLEYSVADIFRSNGPLTVLQCAQQNNQIGCCRIVHEYTKRIRTANPAGVITWTGQSRVSNPISASGTESQFNSEKINVLGVCSSPSMLLIDHWYQCCNISTQSSIINLSISSSASLDEETQQLLALDLDRCCFPEYRHGAKCKLLKNIVITILSGCKTITYRQGMMSLLIPIIEANFYTRSYQPAEGLSALSHTVEANVVNKTVMMFHTILGLFPTISSCYSISEQKRSSAIPQLTQAILPVLRFHYPMLYTALMWNELSLLVFIVPWISTLMAHVLPLRDTLRLWSGLFEMYSAKRLNAKSNASSGSNSAAGSPRSTGSAKSPRASTNNCDQFLVYMVVASLKSLDHHMVTSMQATTLVAKESTGSFGISRNDSGNNLAAAGAVENSSTVPTGPDNSLRKLLETKLTSAVHTASTAVQSASESLAMMSTPRGDSNLLITKQFSIQSDEHILQLLTGINNATSIMQEVAEKKSQKETNIFGYIDGRNGGADSAGGASPSLLGSLGNMLSTNVNSAGHNSSAAGSSSASVSGRSGAGSNNTVQHLLSLYYNSSSAASGNSTPSKGLGSKPNTPTHRNSGSGGNSGVMLHVSPILQVMDKLVANTDTNDLITGSLKSTSAADVDNDLSMWESFTLNLPKLSVFGFVDFLVSRQDFDWNYRILVLEVSPDSVPFANFQSAVPSLHSFHHKRHMSSDENSIASQIVNGVKGLHIDNVVDVFNIDQLQVFGLVNYLKTFAISIGTRVKLNKKPKDEYVKLSTLPNLPPFLKSVIPHGAGKVASFVIIAPADCRKGISDDLGALMGNLANTLTVCGVEQVLVMNSL